MQSRTKKVKDHFDNTDNYLKENLVIGLRTKLLKDNLPFLINKKIVDIGCGNGEVTLQFLEGNKICFLDLSDKMLEIVRSKVPEALYQNATFLNTNLEDNRFDDKFNYVIAIGVLAHVNSLEIAIARLAALMDAEGTLIIQFTNRRNPISIFVKVLSRLKSIIWHKLTYDVNTSSFTSIKIELEKNKMEIRKRLSYWPALPGFRLFPARIRENIYYNVLNSRILRNLGGEVILFAAFNNK